MTRGTSGAKGDEVNNQSNKARQAKAPKSHAQGLREFPGRNAGPRYVGNGWLFNNLTIRLVSAHRVLINNPANSDLSRLTPGPM